VRHVSYVVLFGLVVATLAFGQSQPSATPTAPSASAVIEHMRNTVVQVRSQAAEGAYGGSGFVVAEDYVITNCHVVGLCRANPILTNPTVTVGFRIPNLSTSQMSLKESFRLSHAEIVDTDFANDLTLLKVPAGGRARPIVGIVRGGQMEDVLSLPVVSAKLSDAALSDGTEIFISGFPLLEPSLVTQRGMIASAMERQDVTSLGEPGSHSDVILFDVTVNHGNSGGPVYLAQTGEVVGVAEAFVGILNKVVPVPPTTQPTTPLPPTQPSVVLENSGLGVAIPAKYVIALLAKNHLIATTPTR
jgi:S1-C subfamily serine protease